MRRSSLLCRPLKTPLEVLFVAVLSILLSGCAIQLAPAYDRSIVEGLTAANEQTLTLFASVSSGTRPQTFAQRASAYNALIGKFDALRLQALARPAPRPLVQRVLAIGPPININPEQIEVLDQAPTIPAMEAIVANLTEMRDVDGSRGLTPTRVALFKGSYEIWIDQALVYEKALER